MCASPNTSEVLPSDPSGLLKGLHRQPVLAVLRVSELRSAQEQLSQLVDAGLRHVELAVTLTPAWVELAVDLRQRFPALRLGAASVRCLQGLAAAEEAGLDYVVSPILEPQLLAQAQQDGITLVPGVYTPSEVAKAQALGAPAVKLFPASSVGPSYWSSLAGPLSPLPYCIAAGGLSAMDARLWFESGVDAVALGGSLFKTSLAPHEPPRLRPGLTALLAWLEERADGRLLSD
ncbi:bifunctional 4-hydroxy-2-oxoglutarate aldolase/2-dehydro-3-deoxy-phosphogluconate aldolase [Synechococcus sp. W4D4]|uniref:bifunctional 4-hydroxy-2-oxoglutarate aldolase/2-dehydro-3-deoxy-phosphogluconate aldolase n=1 Tax=Synechococcus sp. W4D4 TaxID=3392294 RepID=UPI0039E9F63B